jgi:GMP synthase-like glutamine amidotransferase
MTAPLLVVQVDPTDPPARLGDWLVEDGHELDVRDLSAGAPLPADLSGHSGMVVLGGAMGAQDDAEYPYLADVRALLRRAVDEEVPALGICLGGQLLAVATGGRVERNPDGPEIGVQLVAKRSVSATDPLFAALPITPDVLQWHVDAVTVLPPGAQQLASSPVCENQAFRVGRLAWGLQFHIETTPEIVRSWAEEDDELADWDLAAVVARAESRDADLVEAWRPFAASFAKIVRDPSSVRAAHAVPSRSAAPITDPAAIRAALAAEAAASHAPHSMPQSMPLGMPGRRAASDPG